MWDYPNKWSRIQKFFLCNDTWFLAHGSHEAVSDMKEDVLGPSYAINKIKVWVEKLSYGMK